MGGAGPPAPPAPAPAAELELGGRGGDAGATLLWPAPAAWRRALSPFLMPGIGRGAWRDGCLEAMQGLRQLRKGAGWRDPNPRCTPQCGGNADRPIRADRCWAAPPPSKARLLYRAAMHNWWHRPAPFRQRPFAARAGGARTGASNPGSLVRRACAPATPASRALLCAVADRLAPRSARSASAAVPRKSQGHGRAPRHRTLNRTSVAGADAAAPRRRTVPHLAHPSPRSEPCA